MRFSLSVFPVAVTAMLALPALADTKQVGAFQSWGVSVSHNAKATGSVPDVCYISAKPVVADGKTHAGVFAEVTHRPAEHHLGVIDILESNPFKPGAPAALAIGKESFALFTHGVAAFARDDDDARIVAAMRGGADDMVFTGTDRKGKPVKEVFSLAGMEQAYQAIGKACRVPTAAPAHAAAKKK